MVNQEGFFYPQKRKSRRCNGCGRHGYRDCVSTPPKGNEYSPRLDEDEMPLQENPDDNGRARSRGSLKRQAGGRNAESAICWLREDVTRATCSAQNGQTGPT